MKTANYEIGFKTEKKYQFNDITDEIVEFVKKSDVKNGMINIQSLHTSSGLLVNENEPLLLEDYKTLWKDIFSPKGKYNHDNFEIRTVNMCEGECQNGHSHLNAAFLDTSVTLNVIDGKINFGRWQRVFFVELDRSRDRKVSLLIMGE